jgi:hypothetical protein
MERLERSERLGVEPHPLRLRPPLGGLAIRKRTTACYSHAIVASSGEASSLAFHQSDFGVIRPSQTSQSFNKPLAPFPETTSVQKMH